MQKSIFRFNVLGEKVELSYSSTRAQNLVQLVRGFLVKEAWNEVPWKIESITISRISYEPNLGLQ